MEEFDIHEFAKMFDAAIASNNPAVKKALRNFLMVAAIVHAEELNEAERVMGPLETLVKKVQDLEARIRQLEYTKTYVGTSSPAYPWNGTMNPTWVYNGTTTSTSSASTETSIIDYKELEKIMTSLHTSGSKYLETLFETKDEQ